MAQVNTLKIMSLPLLVASVSNLLLWGSTRLHVDEVDQLFALKQKKEARQRGEQPPLSPLPLLHR